MIIGIGSDIVDIGRVEKIVRRYDGKFTERYFTDIEISLANKRQESGLYYATYAKRFAAKEACSKALGSGFVGDIVMKDIGVVHDDKGCPSIILTGGALKKLNSIIPNNMKPVMHLSLSDERQYAQAFVVIEAY